MIDADTLDDRSWGPTASSIELEKSLRKQILKRRKDVKLKKIPSVAQFREVERSLNSLFFDQQINIISKFSFKGSLKILQDSKFYVTFVTAVCLFPEYFEHSNLQITMALGYLVSLIDDFSPEVINIKNAMKIINEYKRRFGTVRIACATSIQQSESYNFLRDEYMRVYKYKEGILGLLASGYSLTYLTYINEGNFVPPLLIPLGNMANSTSNCVLLFGSEIINYMGGVEFPSLPSINLAACLTLIISLFIFKFMNYTIASKLPKKSFLRNMNINSMSKELITGAHRGIGAIDLITEENISIKNRIVSSVKSTVNTFVNNEHLNKIYKPLTIMFMAIISFALMNMISPDSSSVMIGSTFGNRKKRTYRTPSPKLRSPPTSKPSPKLRSPSPKRRSPSPKRRSPSPKQRVSSTQFYYM
jgi:hypothetical protein